MSGKQPACSRMFTISDHRCTFKIGKIEDTILWSPALSNTRQTSECYRLFLVHTVFYISFIQLRYYGNIPFPGTELGGVQLKILRHILKLTVSLAYFEYIAAHPSPSPVWKILDLPLIPTEIIISLIIIIKNITILHRKLVKYACIYTKY